MSQSLGGAELLSPALSARLTEALHVAVGGKQITGNWHSYRADQALLSCARMLDVTALERFAELWRKPSVLDAQVEPEPEPRPSLLQRPQPLRHLQQQPPRPLPSRPSSRRASNAAARGPGTRRMRGHLERIVELRLGLHQAFIALRGQA